MVATTISKLQIVDKLTTIGKFISIYLLNTKRINQYNLKDQIQSSVQYNIILP